MEREVQSESAIAPLGRGRRFVRKVGVILAFVPRWVVRTVFVLLPAGLIFLGRWGFAICARLLGWILWPATWIFDRFWGFLERVYPGLLRFSLAHRGLTLAVALGLAGLAVAWYPRLGTDLVPQFSQGQFSFDLELPPGTPLWKTESEIRGIEETLAGDPRIEVLYTSIGESPDLNAAGTQRQGNLAQLGLTVADPTDEEGLVASVRDLLDESNFRYTFRRPSYFSFRTPVEVHLYGYDLEELHTYGTALAARMSDLEGLADVRCNLQDGSPEVQIEFRRDRMASFDLDLESVAQTLRSKIRGDVATRFKEQDRQLDILVRTAEASALDISQVRNLVVSQVEGVPIPLASVADVRLGNGPSEITHIDQQRAAIVRANLSGRDLGSATSDIKEVLADFPPPPSLSADLGGQNDEVATSFRSLLLAVTLAAFMVYMVMASQFESFLHPFVILLTVPLGLVGVIFALGLTGTTVSVVVLIGTVMLTGIVVNNAIVLVDFINQRRKAGLSKLEAIYDAGGARLRPILMTTMTTVLGLLPMAIGLGEGAEIRAPMAIAVIGGLVFTTAITLLVIPVVYASLDRTA
jgi:multidrug efflux pump subunit AcrB